MMVQTFLPRTAKVATIGAFFVVMFCDGARGNLLANRFLKTCFLFFRFIALRGSPMRILEERIEKEGKIYPGNIVKVGTFLNHQLDTKLLMQMGEEIARLYEGAGVNKILTVESSGIAIAVFAGYKMGVPVVFAKKGETKNIQGDVYVTKIESFTHKKVYDVIVSKEVLCCDDKVLIVDDFLANGKALEGLIDIAKQAGAEVVGCAIAIEKGFQGAGDRLRKEGVRVESLALIDEMTDDSVKFRR